MTTLASLADFKRSLTVGSRWQTRYAAKQAQPNNPALFLPHISNWSTKEVVHTQTNGVAFSITDNPDAIATGRANPHRNASWLWYPKAPLCTFQDGAIRISLGDEHHWREYRPLPANESLNQ